MNELYFHPKWKAKRKKILKRDEYKCTACGGKSDLEVHHTYYIDGLAPWLYPDGALLTVCTKCHHDYHLTHEITILEKHPAELIQKTSKKNKPKKKKRKFVSTESLKKQLNGLWQKLSKTTSSKEEKELIRNIQNLRGKIKQRNG